MSIIDELRAGAQKKASYNPALAGRSSSALVGDTQPRIRPRQVSPDRVLEVFNQTRPVQPAPVQTSGLTSGARRILEAAQRPSEPSDGGGGLDIGDVGGWAAKAFSGIIDVVDTPRAALVSGLDQIADMSNGEGFDIGEFVQNTRDNYRFQELMQEHGNAFGSDKEGEGWFGSEGGWAGWVQPTVGFIGDIAADPFTYAIGGTTQLAKGAKATPLDESVRIGARKNMAVTVADEAAKKGLTGSDDVAKLIEAVGRKGRGGLTAKGQEAAGYSDDVLEKLGLNTQFGYRVSTPFTRGKVGVNLGGKRLAEASENTKAILKSRLSDTPFASKFRGAFISGASDGITQAERRWTEALLTGAKDAPEAARGLAAIRMAKNDVFPWLDEQVTLLEKNISPKMAGMKPDELADFTRKLEMGELDTETLKAVRGWYDDIRNQLSEIGVPVNRVENYSPHRLTEKAKRLVINKEGAVGELGLDAARSFQKTRVLKQGDQFMGVRIPVETEGAFARIDQLNQIAKDVAGIKFNLFEDDAAKLMGYYLDDAVKARLNRQVINKAVDEMGIGFRGLNEDQLKELSEAGFDALVEGDQLLKKAAKQQRKTIDKAAKGAAAKRKVVAKELKELEEADQAVAARYVEAVSARDAAQGKVRAYEYALQKQSELMDSLKKAKGSQAAKKGALRKKINGLEKKLEDARGQLARAEDRFAKAENAKQIAASGNEAQVLKAGLDDATQEMKAADEAYKALQADPIAPKEQVAAEQMAEALENVTQVRKEFVSAQDGVTDAAATWVWHLTDTQAKVDRLTNLKNSLDTVVAQKNGIGQADIADLDDRVNTIIKVLKDSDENLLNELGTIEAQALAYDMAEKGGARMVKGSEYRANVYKAMSDPKYQEFMTAQLDEKYRLIDGSINIPEWFDEATSVVPRTMEDWGRARRMLEKYDKAMNIWKGFATTSPGFVFRNLYSGLFNMHLDGVNPNNVRKFNGFLRQYHKESFLASGIKKITPGATPRMNQEFGMENAIKWARKKGYSEREIAAFEGAMRAAGVSGWGLNPQEISTQLVGAKGSWNPFNVEFVPTRVVRGASTNVEALMRGSHAYDVIMRMGGEADSVFKRMPDGKLMLDDSAMNQAVFHVEKFHFNYRDLSNLDRGAKRAIPFWTFYSRNMALQADVWTRYPQKLNRSYFNFKANMELTSDPDQVEPSFFPELGAIRTPFGERDGGTIYLTPDLPSLRFRQDLAELVPGSSGEGFDPIRLLSDTGPAIKVPMEMLQNRELFTDIPFKNRLYDYDSEGNAVLRKGPSILQGEIPFTDIDVPVVSDVMTRLGDLLPGTERVNGDLLMQDNTQSAIEDIIPLIGRAERLDPDSPKQQDRQGQNWLSFIGASVRQNNERSIQGELYSRQKKLEEQAREEAKQRLLEQLAGG